MIEFWSYVDKRGPDECWPWKRCCFKNGYGCTTVFGKNKLAHRVAFFFTHGYWPVVVRHSCDNPPCCNPAHLIAGNHQDNMDDKIQRGRARNLKGDECSWAKLTEQDVPVIKDLLKQGVPGVKIASMYNVHKMTISDIKLERTWRHI